MKILQLRFKNLNSLYGQWQIDFNAMEYSATSIFALTGPTGAGKSTILDAICLALYGATPRLGKITKNSNELMSRQTGECFAEVVFSAKGNQYICHWEQIRAQKKPTGKLQEQRHELAYFTSKKIIESRKSKVVEQIEQITGMDFRRFTRSVMLPQGNFDIFLKTNAEEKSKILEQITGTEIYSTISQRVHRRTNSEQEKLNALTAKIASMNVLTDEQIQKIRQELEQTHKEYQTSERNYANIQKQIVWLQQVEESNKQVQQTQMQADEIEQQIKAFASDKIKLERAQNADKILDKYQLLTTYAEDLAHNRQELTNKNKDFAVYTENLAILDKQLDAQHTAYQQAKTELLNAKPIFKQVRQLDAQIANLQEKLDTLQQQKDSATKDVEHKNIELNNIADNIASKKSHLRKLEDYAQNHQEDAELEEQYGVLELQTNALDAISKDIHELERQIQSQQNELRQISKVLEDHKQKWNLQQQYCTEANAELAEKDAQLSKLLNGKLLREYHNEKEALLREQLLLTQIHNLEDLRKKLIKGEPCPLCGSTQHPFATSVIPATDAVENKIQILQRLIEQATNYNEQIEKLTQKQQELQRTKSAIEKDINKYETENKFSAAKLTELTENLARTTANFATKQNILFDRLAKFGYSDLNQTLPDSQSILQQLQTRKSLWKKNIESIETLKSELQELDVKNKIGLAFIENKTTIIKDIEENIFTVTKNLADIKLKRQELFGDKTPDKEETQLQFCIDNAESALNNLKDNHTQINAKIIALKSDIDNLNALISDQTTALEKQQKIFDIALQQSVFSDTQDFLDAILDLDDIKILQNQADELKENSIAIYAQLDSNKSNLAKLKSENLTDKSLEQLHAVLDAEEHNKKQLQYETAKLTQQLENNASIEQDLIKTKAEVIRQESIFNLWKRLHNLIGSADGKKYRSFAQGITFDVLINNANLQLAKMNDRYKLIRDQQQNLEINVIDDYQAGEIRSSKNLSGGESFIVSLALALGLSKMVSNNAQIDSLFLDEGFGTLDENSLDTALNALTNLEGEGKLIGIISHITALQERLDTQIQIQPCANGKSKIIGPGCSKI